MEEEEEEEEEEAQILQTEPLQHYIPQKRGLLQVYNCKYRA